MTDEERKKDISAEEVYSALESGEELVLVDVRTDEEHKERHIPGDKHMSLVGKSMDELSDKIKDIAGDVDEVVLYCESGARSGMACDMLGSLGFDNIKSMSGGIGAWEAQGYGVEKR